MDCNDVVGKRFNQIVVLSYSGRRNHTHNTIERGVRDGFTHRYLCQCDCGRTFEMDRSNVITKHKVSCGCHWAKSNRSNWNGHGGIGSCFWNRVKRHAISRGLPLEITIEDAWEIFMIQKGQCALSGVPLILDYHRDTKEGRDLSTASLDRIDSAKGYIKGNVQWVHKKLNGMKGNLSENLFFNLCCAVATYRGHHEP